MGVPAADRAQGLTPCLHARRRAATTDPERRRPDRSAALGARAGPRVDGHRCRAVDRRHAEHRGAGARRRASDGVATAPASPTADERQDDAARDRGAAHPGRHTGAAPRVHRRMRRPRRARRGVLPHGGDRRLQPRQRDGRGVRARRRHAPSGRAVVRCAASRNSAMSPGRAARSRSSSGRVPFWSARFRSSCGCSKAIGTIGMRPNRWPSESLRSGWSPTARQTGSRGSCTATRI